ncbi:MAG: carbohydrate-binding protein, partial [Pontiellaceae bacterium]|nr:carbohydrate-binding protein [Pontiellaceae bacterium]
MRALYASLLLIASAHAAEVIQGFDIQAETFTSQSSCEVKDENAGYSGAGYIDYGSAGSYIEWNDIVAATSGMYLLDVRYASSFDRPCSVIVNGITVGQLNCEATGDWDQWETERMIISLNSGMNTLRISAIGSGPNIDKIKATALVNPADHQFFKHAENYTALNGCSISTANSGYTGTGYIDYGNAETYTEWNNINVTADGLYSTTIRYAGYGDRPCSIRVNGISIGQLDFNSTGSWSSWANENIVLPLKNGANTVRITAIGAGPNIDSMNFSGLNNASIPSVSSFVKDAETAGTMSDCTASSSYSGYTGSGYADYGDAGSYVQWNNVAVSSSGTYGLFIRYATPFDRPCELRVNGIYIGDLNFSSTGDWTAWKSEYAAVPLNSGSNYIRITAIGAGPNIDKIEGAAQSIPTTLLAPSLSGFALQA